MEILTVKDLNFTYPGAKAPALSGVGFAVNEGEFIVLAGPTGCGKTTLLRLLKSQISPHGERSGEIRFAGEDAAKAAAGDIGFVFQDPDAQIVTDKVWHELAFGLENTGVPAQIISRRVAEMASYFGLGPVFHSDTASLSGGQKQLVNLASVMAMRPRLLLLDEPTASLDPIAAADLLSVVARLNREFGLTVIVVEHRLDDIFALADRVMLMDGGGIFCCDTPREVGMRLALSTDEVRARLLPGLPAPVRLFSVLGGEKCPLTVGEGREYLLSGFAQRAMPVAAAAGPSSAGETVLEACEASFRYAKDAPDILRDFSLRLRAGELLCVLGANGSGKTTALKVCAGLLRPWSGSVRIFGKKINSRGGAELYRSCLAYLPQDPVSAFVSDSVRGDLEEILRVMGVAGDKMSAAIAEVCEMTGVGPFLDCHPYDLSGGEQQKCALARVLLTRPRILLLDEPTKGLDAVSRASVGELLRSLCAGGTAVAVVTHDTDFAAGYADRAALLFDGNIVCSDEPGAFFSGNSFYTTAAARMAGGLFPGAVTVEQILSVIGGAEYERK